MIFGVATVSGAISKSISGGISTSRAFGCLIKVSLGTIVNDSDLLGTGKSGDWSSGGLGNVILTGDSI